MYYEKDLLALDSSFSDVGVIAKWYDEKNKYYIKASSYLRESKKYHIEAVMECIASKVGELFGVPVVHYWLDMLRDLKGNDILVCVSKDFKVSGGDYLTANMLLVSSDSDEPRSKRYPALTSHFPNTRQDLDGMILFDFIIDNYDRHLRNFEFLMSDDESQVRVAPLFDNGSSLLSDILSDEDLEDLREDEDNYDSKIRLGDTPSKSFSHEHLSSLRLCDINSFAKYNWTITKEDFENIVTVYSPFLTPLRQYLIIELLWNRYNHINKFRHRLVL